MTPGRYVLGRLAKLLKRQAMLQDEGHYYAIATVRRGDNAT